MSYLFGDSTPSQLTSNFIELLRETLDFSVHVLLADGRVGDLRAAAERDRRATNDDIGRLRAMEAAILRSIEAAAKGGAESATALAAAEIVRSVAVTVRAHEVAVQGDLGARVAKLEDDELSERAGCLAALEALLVRHDPPGACTTLRLVQQPAATYVATVDGTTPYGLDYSLAVEIPPGHVFGHVLRVEKLVAHLEVQAPEAAGWIRKEVKLRPQRLERFYVAGLTISETMSTTMLRADADGKGAGFDVIIGPEAPRVRFVRAGGTEDGSDAPFEITEEDAGKLVTLHDKVVLGCADLLRARKGITSATLDGVRFQEHPQSTTIVDRLIRALAPTTLEIARHSLTPTELVLKRLVAGDRREEIFVSKALFEKLAPLPAAARERFEPLGLGVPRPPPSSHPSSMRAPPFSAPPARLELASSDMIAVAVSTSDPGLNLEPTVILDDALQDEQLRPTST